MVDTKKRKIIGVRFPNLYLWLVFLSALDVVLTRVILYFGGTEVNPLADWIIINWGQMGMSLFKFGIVAFVISICEYTARLDQRMAFRLALAGCIISALPVIWSSGLVIHMILTFDPTSEPPPPALPEGLSPTSMLIWLRSSIPC